MKHLVTLSMSYTVHLRNRESINLYVFVITALNISRAIFRIRSPTYLANYFDHQRSHRIQNASLHYLVNNWVTMYRPNFHCSVFQEAFMKCDNYLFLENRLIFDKLIDVWKLGGLPGGISQQKFRNAVGLPADAERHTWSDWSSVSIVRNTALL